MAKLPPPITPASNYYNESRNYLYGDSFGTTKQYEMLHKLHYELSRLGHDPRSLDRLVRRMDYIMAERMLREHEQYTMAVSMVLSSPEMHWEDAKVAERELRSRYLVVDRSELPRVEFDPENREVKLSGRRAGQSRSVPFEEKHTNLHALRQSALTDLAISEAGDDRASFSRGGYIQPQPVVPSFTNSANMYMTTLDNGYHETRRQFEDHKRAIDAGLSEALWEGGL
jgi:hypothetical protein